MRSGIVGGNTRRKLSVAEFRGFVVSDDLAPLVFINGRDAKAAQIFTLAHELAHIWIGTSGISNTAPQEVSREQSNVTERFCNAVAAEVLVPEVDFQTACRNVLFTHDALKKLAARYRVSIMVVLRRAYDLGKIGRDQFFKLLAEEQHKQQERAVARTEDSGGNFYLTLPARNSRRLTETVLEALQGGSLMHREAAKLLGVKVATLPKLLEGRARS
jgi:Zn-dependent peptidase ImmA (M78 family)